MRTHNVGGAGASAQGLPIIDSVRQGDCEIMESKIVDVLLEGIDLDSIGDAEENAEAVVFDIKMSSAPGLTWREEFEIVYRNTHFEFKPPIFIDGDRLRIHYLPRYAGELDKYLAFVTKITRRATEEARITEAITTDEAHEERKRKFRELLKTAVLPE